MSALHEWSDGDLAYELRKQLWHGISTWGPGVCGHNARGSGHCADCIQAEMKRRTLTGGNDNE